MHPTLWPLAAPPPLQPPRNPPNADTNCPHCHLTFQTPSDLGHHIRVKHPRDSQPASHAGTAHCPHCQDVSFSTAGKLAQHIREKHALEPQIRYPCDYCPQSGFVTLPALVRHMRLHHPGQRRYDFGVEHACDLCPTTFATLIRFARHVTKEHPPPPDPVDNTPLDRYFYHHRAVHDFQYNRRSLPSWEWNRLRKYMRWDEGTPDLAVERARYGKAFRQEMALWFGGGGGVAEVHAMHRFHRAVGWESTPYSVRSMRRRVGRDAGCWVNLVDLLHWVRHEATGDADDRSPHVDVYEDMDELADYSKRFAKTLPALYWNDGEKEGDWNDVERALLSNTPRSFVAAPEDGDGAEGRRREERGSRGKHNYAFRNVKLELSS
ncbi:uncharacterized protein BKCO1_680006 [Diplodia corticola]|uniref:C2H2-type domain-containing protein n=1 Tax=Diplodia corticola TaxID=236234 RepID=A0A1J9QM46_9PEZI|nr:uncharacterized protein BKCO1_680006 [Diplodia corticola]OJD29982.1 hypothetical protein BKCO1_680006 [Diplodia corticola]